MVKREGPLGKAASTTDATFEAVVAGGYFFPLPLLRQAAAFAATSLTELAGATMDDISIRTGGRGDCRGGGGLWVGWACQWWDWWVERKLKRKVYV